MIFLKKIKILFIAFFLTLGVFLIAFFNLFQKWNWVVNDTILYDEMNTPSSEIVIVAIDDKSLADDAMGRWQEWERSDYADLIGKLEEYEAAVIGLDITFSEHSKDIESDQQLADVLQKYDNIVIGQDSGGNKVISEFKKNNASVGVVEFPVEEDQKVRKTELSFENVPYEHFTIALIKKYLNLSETESFLDSQNQKYVISEQAVRIPGTAQKISSIPLDKEEKAYINFFGPPNAYTYISFIDVIRGEVNPAEIKGKIILVGEDASSLYDEKNVPVSAGKPMPGVEIHANFIQTILDGKFLIPQSKTQEFVAIALAVFLSCYLFYLFTPFITTLVFIVVVLLIIFLWAELAPLLGRIVNIFYILLGVVVSYITIFVYRYATVEKARQKIEKAFSMYVSKDIVAEIKKHPEMLNLGGEKRVMTAFFSDIQGFTSISETISPEVLVALLNEYFSAMTKILFKYGGTLDKYEGDAIMAFWNAPALQPDHALQACLTALKMQQHLEILRLKWKKEGKPDLKVRMGINTGEMIAGNVGSSDRFDYTIMGDAVNLSSRLEGANKYYGTYLMVSETTYAATKDHFEYRELDLLKVKGKNNSVRVYELLTRKGHLDDTMRQMLPHYKAGIEAYYQQKWDYALTHFNKVLEIDATDGPTNLYVSRCQKFKEKPPVENWDGSYELKAK